MSERVEFFLTLAAALGAGLSGGVLFAFSVSIMPALARLQPAAGIAAMQSINTVILNPLFFLAFFGPALLGLALAAAALLGWTNSPSWTLIGGAALDLIGVIGITIVVNVPMNDALAAVDPTSAQGAAVWSDYLVRWSAWNHVRTVAGILASASFILALR